MIGIEAPAFTQDLPSCIKQAILQAAEAAERVVFMLNSSELMHIINVWPDIFISSARRGLLLVVVDESSQFLREFVTSQP